MVLLEYESKQTTSLLTLNSTFSHSIEEKKEKKIGYIYKYLLRIKSYISMCIYMNQGNK